MYLISSSCDYCDSPCSRSPDKKVDVPFLHTPVIPFMKTIEACVVATDKPNHSRTGCAAEGDVFERDRKSSVVGRGMGL